MRRSALVFAAVLSLAAAAAQAQTLMAPIDQSVTVALPAAAADVVIGNPAIADVQLINARQALVLGKGYGVTSLQVFDNQGRSILARQVVVSSVDENRVSYFRGGELNNYSCAPRCERTPMPGEVQPVYTPYAVPYSEYANRRKAQAAPAAP
jgi:hypothetical protein